MVMMMIMMMLMMTVMTVMMVRNGIVQRDVMILEHLAHSGSGVSCTYLWG